MIISDTEIKFPEVLCPHILLSLSQEAYESYSPRLRQGGVLIVDQDLVNAGDLPRIRCLRLPFTAEAEKLNRRILANVIALGALATFTGVVKPESIAMAIPSRLPEHNVPLALQALQVGVRMA